MNSEAYVHLGHWTNWSDGRLKGARLTLTESGGAYLIAFLALFVRLAGQHSWGILCYLIFRQRQKRLNVGYDQRRDSMQSILRNMNVDLTAAWQFMRLRWHLRLSERTLFRRSIIWALLAVTHAILFIAAGVFVSKVAETGKSEVLLRGQACGIWQDPADFDLYSSGSQADSVENTLWVAWIYGSSATAADFSRQCYNTTSADSALANCNAYAPNLISWSIDDHTICPFDDKMCRNGSAIKLDTGYLDSLHHFGINAHADDRVKYRRVVECSPITRDGYVSDILSIAQVNLSANTIESIGGVPQQNTLFEAYNYGPNQPFYLESTYVWNNYTPVEALNLGDMLGAQFMMDVELYLPDNLDVSNFLAIEELNRTDADVVLFFMISAMHYAAPVYDPWFQSTTPVPSSASNFVTSDNNETMFVYGNDYNAGVMGCTQQFQYCNHDGSKCSILTGSGYGGSLINSIQKFAEGLDLNMKQLSTLSRLAQASWGSDLYLAAMPPNGLLVQRELTGALSPPLPDNQWVLEMQHYFLSGLTNMQMQLASYATGPPDRTSYQYLTKPTAEDEWMCSSQIVQRSGYATFSLLGIIVVIFLGSLIIVTDLALPTIATKSRQRSDVGSIDEWDECHHLHTCSGYDKVVPEKFTADSPDTNSLKAGHAVVAASVDDWIPQDGFTNNIRAPGATMWSSPYVNDFSRDIDGSPRKKRISQRERLKQMFRKREEEGSESMVDQDRTV